MLFELLRELIKKVSTVQECWKLHLTTCKNLPFPYVFWINQINLFKATGNVLDKDSAKGYLRNGKKKTQSRCVVVFFRETFPKILAINGK